jgi:2-oxo-hept-3-ene-1,7-dioate hydratase
MLRMTTINDLDKNVKKIQGLAGGLASQWLAGERRSLITIDWPECTLQQAYKIQSDFVSELSKSESVSGYKAAVSNSAVQKMFATTVPASGILFANNAFSTGASIALNRFQQPILETEIGYKLNANIESLFGALDPSSSLPVTAENVFEYVDAIMPVIEIADVGFSARLTSLVDLVSANTAFGGYVLGEEFALSDVDIKTLDTIAIGMSKDGEPIGSGAGGDTSGGQCGSLAWLINQVYSLGYRPKAGDYLLTGSLGKVYVGQTGVYEAVYNGLGRVDVTLT